MRKGYRRNEQSPDHKVIRRFDETGSASHPSLPADLDPNLALSLESLELSAAVTRNLIKPFFIAGFILGELLGIVLLLTPHAPGHPGVHWSGAITALILFGPFGGAAGGGIGILATALLSKLTRKGGVPPPALATPPAAPATTPLDRS